MNELGGILALIVGAGLVGGFMMARRTSGVRGLFGWLLWLALPFPVLAVILFAQSDPTLPAERAGYNFSFGFALIATLIMIPWLAGNVVGGLVGYLLPRRKRGSGGDDLPDWSRADDPLLTVAELGELMHAAAELADIEKRLLPHIGAIAVGDGVFIARDKRGYRYAGRERGMPMFEHRSAIADQILYLVFRDCAGVAASGQVAVQQARLGMIDPAWASQFAYERGQAAGV